MQELNIQNLIQAGAHFGHELRKWNPKMKPFVYREQGGIHIIDLQKTLICARKAMDFFRGKNIPRWSCYFCRDQASSFSLF